MPKAKKKRAAAGSARACTVAAAKKAALGRPTGSSQWGYRVCATIAHELAKRHQVSVVLSARAAAAFGRTVQWAGDDSHEIDEESVRQTVYALRRSERKGEPRWVHASEGILRQAALHLQSKPGSVVDALKREKEGILETQRLAESRGIKFTPQELSVIDANNYARARAAIKERAVAPFAKKTKK